MQNGMYGDQIRRSASAKPVQISSVAPAPAVLTHVHEFEGSAMLAELEEDPHNHRIAGVTGPVIVVPGGHVHSVLTRTDFFDDHYHFVDTTTGLPIPVGGGKHVHFVTGTTTEADDHMHQFQFATLILDPLEAEVSTD